MATKRLLSFFIVLILPIVSGCGVVYTNVTRPYSSDFNNTPIGSKQCTINARSVTVPTGRVRVSAEWATGTIVEAAREKGMTKIYYADQHELNILLGTYRRRSITIYGD
jgi:hypothetical protein